MLLLLIGMPSRRTMPAVLANLMVIPLAVAAVLARARFCVFPLCAVGHRGRGMVVDGHPFHLDGEVDQVMRRFPYDPHKGRPR